ncbi:MAG: hypothetical protein Q7S21_06065 [archaeon]|nr:hypothetical protein [archaeon]
MVYGIIKTILFDEDFDKLEKVNKQRVEKILNQLAYKDGNVGKPLRVPFFKEKKFNGNRLYFLVYEEFKKILIIRIGKKKLQQQTINQTLNDLEKYKEFVITQLEK